MDKFDKLFDIIEHPECYSGREIEAMLADEEVRRVYDLLSMTKSSLTPVAAPDVDAEWKDFKRSRRKYDPGLFNIFSRNAAASIAVVLVSVAAVAAVVGISVNRVPDTKYKTSSAESVVINEVTSTDSAVAVTDTPAAPAKTIIFENEPLVTIISRISEYYGYKTEFSTDAASSLRLYFRWDQALPVDEVIESLNNFEQIHLAIEDETIIID